MDSVTIIRQALGIKITYPLVSGNFNITVGDISARRMAGWDSNLMIATVPAEQPDSIYSFQTRFAGKRGAVMPTEMQRVASRLSVQPDRPTTCPASFSISGR